MLAARFSIVEAYESRTRAQIDRARISHQNCFWTGEQCHLVAGHMIHFTIVMGLSRPNLACRPMYRYVAYIDHCVR